MRNDSRHYCARIVRASGSNFAASFRFLDRPQRRAMTAFYAFCRVIDDVVDSKFDITTKQRLLQFWRDQITPSVMAVSHHPLVQELRVAIEMFNIPLVYLQDLISGVAMDIEPTPFADFPALEQYCYGVAGTVGLTCLRIFRVTETPTTRAAGLALANAFQLTNILRDFHDDVRNGRRYLPLADLTQFGLQYDDLNAATLTATHTTALTKLIHYECARAKNFFTQAWQGFPADDRKRLKPALLMSDYYFHILTRINAAPLAAWNARTQLSTGHKLWLIIRRLFSAQVLPDLQPACN